MAIQYFNRTERRPPNEGASNVINSLGQAFTQLLGAKRQAGTQSLENAYKLAQIQELQRKAKTYGQQATINSSSPIYQDPMTGAYRNNPAFVRPLNPLQQMQLETAQNKKTEADILKQDKEELLKQSAEENLKTIEEVKKGKKYFGPLGNFPTLATPSGLLGEYAQRKNWETNINKLLSGRVLDVMTSMKQASKTGATGFGQLSNKELAVLQEASTALKKDLSPEDAMKYLSDIENIHNKVLSGGSSGVTNQQFSYPNGLNPSLGSNDPLEAEAQAAIASGKDPNLVRQRLQQLRTQRG